MSDNEIQASLLYSCVQKWHLTTAGAFSYISRLISLIVMGLKTVVDMQMKMG